MLRTIKPGIPRAIDKRTIPDLLAPLWRTAQKGAPLEAEMLVVVNSLGFDSFMYGMSTASHPLRDSRSYVWTTLPREWVSIYDQNAYIEIDPRLTETWQRVTPLLWDRHSHAGDLRAIAFLDHAAQYGVGSGVVVPLRDPLHAMVVVALNAKTREIDEQRRREINANLGDIVLLAAHFHEIFMASILDTGATPRQQGAPLSAREIQCLRMASHGLTSSDIAQKLGLAERTVNFHFSNVLSKLAVANRGEAIAVAIGRRMLND